MGGVHSKQTRLLCVAIVSCCQAISDTSCTPVSSDNIIITPMCLCACVCTPMCEYIASALHVHVRQGLNHGVVWHIIAALSLLGNV